MIAQWCTASAFPLGNSVGHYEGLSWLRTTEDRNVDVMFNVKIIYQSQYVKHVISQTNVNINWEGDLMKEKWEQPYDTDTSWS